METQYVSFLIAGQRYCIDILDVKEVVRENEITRMPDSPSFVEGIMNLRGIVIPVISLARKLGLASDRPDTQNPQNTARSAKLIIVSLDGVLIALSVDALDRVFSADSAQIQPADQFTDSSLDRSLLSGIVKADETLTVILDIRKILDIEEQKFIRQEIVD